MSSSIPQNTLTLFDGKVCCRCGAWKPLADYGRDKHTPDGHNYACRACKYVEHQTRYEADKERHKQRFRDYYQSNKEDWVAKRHARKPQQAVIAKAWRARKKSDDPHFLAKEKERRRLTGRNPATWKANNHRRRARIRGNGGSFTRDEWVALCAQYNHRCLACGERLPLTVDHIVPISRGGLNTISNIQPLCLSCNISKGTKIIDYRAILES